MAEPGASYPIIDVIEARVEYGAPAPGFILVPEGFRPGPAEAMAGASLVIEPPGGWAIVGTIAEARDHGTTISLLVEDWPADFPAPRIGWRVSVPAFASPGGSGAREAAASRSEIA